MIVFALLSSSAVVSDLPLSRSMDLARAAIVACESRGAAVSAAVVDAQGVPVVILRADGSPKAPVAAPRKAATAVKYAASGAELEQREKTDSDFAAFIAAHADQYNVHGGSLPLYKGGRLVGGLAVADTDHALADTCARAAVAAVPLE